MGKTGDPTEGLFGRFFAAMVNGDVQEGKSNLITSLFPVSFFCMGCAHTQNYSKKLETHPAPRTPLFLLFIAGKRDIVKHSDALRSRKVTTAGTKKRIRSDGHARPRECTDGEVVECDYRQPSDVLLAMRGCALPHPDILLSVR